MTAKEYLRQIYYIGQQIRQMQETLSTIKADLYSAKSPDYVSDRVQSSSSGDSMERMIAKADRLTSDINKSIARKLAVKNKIICQINDLPERTDAQRLQKLVLYDRYVLCYKWDAIADKYHVSIRYVYVMHGNALSTFSRLYLT